MSNNPQESSGELSRHINSFLKQQAACARGLIRASTLLSVSAGLVMIAAAAVLADITNQVIFSNAVLADINTGLLLLLGLYLMRAVITGAGSYTAFLSGTRIRNGLGDAMAERFVKPEGGDDKKQGGLVTTFIDGLDALQRYYAQVVPARLATVLIPVCILVIVFPIDWLSGIIFLITAPLIPVFMILIGKGAEDLNRRQWQRMAQLGGHFMEAVQGLSVLKMLNASRREATALQASSAEFRRETMSVLRLAFLSSLTLEFFATVSIALVAVTVGFRLLWGNLDFQSGFLVLLLAPEFYLPLRRLGANYHTKLEAIAAAGQIMNVLQAKAEPVSSVGLRPDFAHIELRFEDVTFSYHVGTPVLKNISLELAPRQLVALIGESGSGKTTLLALALGLLQPDTGQIYVNNIPFQEIDRAWLWQHLGYMPQQVRLFSRDVAANIALDRQNISAAQVEQLALELEIGDLLVRDTTGESGRLLSGGQVQRIGLARALAHEPALLVLDEPTAFLDAHSESLIQAVLQRSSRQRTMLVAAHRLETLVQADRIYVLKAGEIISSGSHAELAATSSYYRECLALESEPA